MSVSRIPASLKSSTRPANAHFNITLPAQYQTYTSMARTHFNITLQLQYTLQISIMVFGDHSPTDITKKRASTSHFIRTTYAAHLTSRYNPTETGSKMCK
jgi:hypothetical protein